MRSNCYCFVLILLTIAVLLTAPAGPGPVAAEPSKIHPEVLAQLRRDGQGTFLVQLAEQANLTPAYQIHDWDERGWFVYNALREVAGCTQPAVLRALGPLQRAGDISVNDLYIRQADPHLVKAVSPVLCNEPFTWDLGDGTMGTGMIITHSYAAGAYSVTLTATNCLGAGQAVRRDTLVVAPLFHVYLPLVERSYALYMRP